MVVEGAVRRLGGALVACVVVAVGVSAAASPGSLQPGDPATWAAVALIIGSAGVIGWAGALLLWRTRPTGPKRRRERTANHGLQAWLPVLLAILAAGAVIFAFLELTGGGRAGPRSVPRLHLPSRPTGVAKQGPSGSGPDLGPWLALVAGLMLLAFLIWVLMQRFRLRRPVDDVELLPGGDPLLAAVQAALIDLEGEQDPRRAVIQAYARTEAVLRAHGLPRHPAEAPLEYLDRVLRELGARAASVDRLTVLFERAAFSRHDVGPEMRDEAVAAFHGLRDDLVAGPADSETARR